MFLNLCYPKHFISRCLRLAREKFYSPQAPRCEDSALEYVVLPYCDELLKLRTPLLKLGYKIVFNFKNSIGRFLIKNSPASECGGVYIIKCSDCDRCYVGETLKTLPFRVSQHKYCFRNCDENNSIFCHAFYSDHRIDWSSPKFIFRGRDKGMLRFIEALYIGFTSTFNRAPAQVAVDVDVRNAAALVLRRSL